MWSLVGVGVTLLVLSIVSIAIDLRDRRSLWRRVTDQQLANQQGDLLRIEQKLDDIDLRLHGTLGAQSARLDDQSVIIGELAADVSRERKHVNLIGAAGELTVSAMKTFRTRIEELEAKA